MKMSQNLKTDLLPKLRAQSEPRGKIPDARRAVRGPWLRAQGCHQSLGNSVPAPIGRVQSGSERRHALIKR